MQRLADQAVSDSSGVRNSSSFTELWEDLGTNEATRRFSAMRRSAEHSTVRLTTQRLSGQRESTSIQSREFEAERKHLISPEENGRLTETSKSAVDEALTATPPSTSIDDGRFPPASVMGKWEPCNEAILSESTLHSPRGGEQGGLQVKRELFNQLDSNGSFEGLWEDIAEPGSARARRVHQETAIHQVVQIKTLPQQTESIRTDCKPGTPDRGCASACLPELPDCGKLQTILGSCTQQAQQRSEPCAPVAENL